MEKVIYGFILTTSLIFVDIGYTATDRTTPKTNNSSSADNCEQFLSRGYHVTAQAIREQSQRENEAFMQLANTFLVELKNQDINVQNIENISGFSSSRDRKASFEIELRNGDTLTLEVVKSDNGELFLPTNLLSGIHRNMNNDAHIIFYLNSAIKKVQTVLDVVRGTAKRLGINEDHFEKRFFKATDNKGLSLYFIDSVQFLGATNDTRVFHMVYGDSITIAGVAEFEVILNGGYRYQIEVTLPF